MQGSPPNGNGRPPKFLLGEYTVDAGARTVSSPAGQVLLAPRTMDVLAYLAAHASEVVTHRELLDAFWRGTISSPNAVHKCITELRQALADDATTPRFIATLPRRGYRLLVDPVPASASALAMASVGTESPASQMAASDPGDEGGGAHAVTATNTLASDVTAPMSATPARRRWKAIAVAGLVLTLTSAAAWFGQREEVASPEGFEAPDRFGASTGVIAGSPDPDNVTPDEHPEPATDMSVPDASKRIVLVPLHTADAASRALASEIEASLGAGIERQTRLQVLAPGMSRDMVVGRDGAGTVRAIATEQGAAFAITGEVARAAQGTRVHMLLWHAASGRVLHAFDRVLTGPQAQRVGAAGAAMTAAAQVLTNPDGGKAMSEVGARDPEAFLVFEEAIAVRSLRDQASTRRALDTYKAAIALDPTFLRAYELFADDAPGLMQYTTDKQVHAGLLAEVQALRRAVLKQRPTAETLRVFDHAESRLRGDAYATREGQVRAQFAGLKPGDACICYNEYFHILVAGRLYDEAEHFRLRVLHDQPGNPFFSRTARSSIIRLRDGPFLAKYAIKEALVVFPNDVAVLSGIVPVLAQTGDFEEAEQYLRHLESVDRDGNWAYNARLLLQALRGDLKLGSPELRRALEHPRNTTLGTGIVLFTLGDVPGGVEAWGSLTPQEFDTLATFAAFIETTFPKQVLQDPRYQALLERLGIGASWTAQLRRNVASIAHVTGIPPGPYAEPAPGTPVATSARTSRETTAN